MRVGTASLHHPSPRYPAHTRRHMRHTRPAKGCCKPPDPVRDSRRCCPKPPTLLVPPPTVFATAAIDTATAVQPPETALAAALQPCRRTPRPAPSAALLPPPPPVTDPGRSPDHTAHPQASAQDNNDQHARVWPGDCVFPDFTAQKARAWWASHYQQLLVCAVCGAAPRPPATSFGHRGCGCECQGIGEIGLRAGGGGGGVI